MYKSVIINNGREITSYNDKINRNFLEMILQHEIKDFDDHIFLYCIRI